MRNRSLRSLAFLTVAALAAGATPALAGDAKIYGGATCLVDGDSPAIARTAGRGYNTASTTTTFQCPALKDADDIYGVKLYVVDQNFDTNFYCWVSSQKSESFGLPTFTIIDLSSGTSPAPQLLDFSAAGLDAYDGGYYHLTCNVPGTYGNGAIRSGIVSYRVGEND